MATAAVVAAAFEVAPPAELARAVVADVVEPPCATATEVRDVAPPEVVVVVVVAVVLVLFVAVTPSGWMATGVVVVG